MRTKFIIPAAVLIGIGLVVYFSRSKEKANTPRAANSRESISAKGERHIRDVMHKSKKATA